MCSIYILTFVCTIHNVSVGGFFFSSPAPDTPSRQDHHPCPPDRGSPTATTSLCWVHAHVAITVLDAEDLSVRSSRLFATKVCCVIVPAAAEYGAVRTPHDNGRRNKICLKRNRVRIIYLPPTLLCLHNNIMFSRCTVVAVHIL